MIDEQIESITEVMPYLDILINFKPMTNFLINEKKVLLTGFRGIALSEATFINKFQETREQITKEMKGTGLDFIKIFENIEISQNMKLLKEEQLNILINAYVELANEYEQLADSKKEVVRIPTEPVTEDMIKEIQDKYKQIVDQFMKTLKKAKGRSISTLKYKFINDVGESNVEKLILEKMINEYGTKDNNTSKDSEDD